MQQSQERLDAASQQDVRDIAAPPQIPAHEAGTSEVVQQETAGSDAAKMIAEPRTRVSETTGLFQAESDQPISPGPISPGPISTQPISTRPDKFQLETRLIELNAALIAVQQLFSHLERDFYLAAFGRYDE